MGAHYTELNSDSGPNFGRIRASYVCVSQLAAVAAVFASLASLKVMAMLDFVMIALGVAFFAASVLYVLACERM